MNLNSGRTSIEKSKDASLRAMIKQNVDMFRMALPKAITAERMMRIAMTAVTSNPNLANCSQASFFGALLTATQLGLEVNTPLGQSYLIPYDTKNGKQCQFQLGYQGMLELAYRSERFKRIKAVVVYKDDIFKYSYGLIPELTHEPKGTGEPIYVYALYELKNGGTDFEVWSWEKVMKHAKTYSKSFNNGPWKTAPEEMAKKTVLKSLLKYAPKAVELSGAVAMDEGVIQKEMVIDTGYAYIEDHIEQVNVLEEENQEKEEEKETKENDNKETLKQEVLKNSDNSNGEEFPL